MPTKQIYIFDEDVSAAAVTQHGLKALLDDAVDVGIASSQNAAWMACAKGDVDLLIVDPGPPSGSAVSLIRAVRVYRPQIPILVLTAYDTPGLRASMRSLGVNLYVAKPVDLRDLAPIVNGALRLSAPDSIGLARTSAA